MYRICKSFRFEAAHQLLPGTVSTECSDCIHGHSYKVEIVVTSSGLDMHDMVLDFAVLRPVIEEIRKDWDHALILPTKLGNFYRSDPHLKKVVVVPCNPTAEFFAREIAGRVARALAVLNANVERVRVCETAKCWAEYIVE